MNGLHFPKQWLPGLRLVNSMDVPVTTYNDNSDDVDDWLILMIKISNKK